MKSFDLKEIRKYLIVVDMVNGFVKEGKLADPKIMEIVPNIITLINDVLKEKEGLAFIKDTHSIDSLEFKSFPLHCIKGTKEQELISELAPYEERGLVYEKNSTSTMFAKGFLEDINTMKSLREVIITGCCTDICIMNLALPLKNYFNELNKDINITIFKDAVATYDNRFHKSDEWENMSYKFLEQAGVNLVERVRR